jgi:hypothetical protein
VVIVAVGLAILPEIVRRVAVDQVPKLTGRILAIDDVDLNLFTGHVALKGVRFLKQGVNERALELERLDVRIGYLPFLFRTVRVKEISLVGAKASILRRGPTEFDFSDVLDRLKGRQAAGAQGVRLVVQVDDPARSGLAAARARFMHDATTSPGVTGDRRPGDRGAQSDDRRGRAAGKSRGEAQVERRADHRRRRFARDRAAAAVRPASTVDGFDLAPLPPYLASAPAAPRAGKVKPHWR